MYRWLKLAEGNVTCQFFRRSISYLYIHMPSRSPYFTNQDLIFLNKNKVHFPRVKYHNDHITFLSLTTCDFLPWPTGFPYRNKTWRLGLPSCFRMAWKRSLLMTFKAERFHNTGSRCFYKAGPYELYMGWNNPYKWPFKEMGNVYPKNPRDE